MHVGLVRCKPDYADRQSSFLQVFFEMFDELPLLIISECDDVRLRLNDVLRVARLVAHDRLIHKRIRRDEREPLCLMMARWKTFDARGNGVARDRDDKIRVGGKRSRLPKEVLMPRMHDIECPKDHDPHHTFLKYSRTFCTSSAIAARREASSANVLLSRSFS